MKGQYAQFSKLADMYKLAKKWIEQQTGNSNPSREQVEALQTDSMTSRLKNIYIYFLDNDLVSQIEEGTKYFDSELNYHYNLDFHPRYKVGDDPNNPNQHIYGNNHYGPGDPLHGTHVSGIIAALRNNGIGIDGIADSVKIMVVRVVPDGDERDKDVANGIRYAVDNGAQVLNMSFGKPYSPNRPVVEAAIKYAMSKGVLMVHAAGNDSQDIDDAPNYPTKRLKSEGGKAADNWLEVGALAPDVDTFKVASYSNYGRKTVDIFAPGSQILSTVPDNKYKRESGTSMASPVVAGVAALVWSYYPSLTAVELKKILIKSGLKMGKTKVTVPGTKKKEKFKKLSRYGREVNAYNALEMAAKKAK